MANRLIHEQSPYLLQHAHNPVDWYAWGDEPFKRAEKENKPVLVSIGYAACHWCHVMEHESFEDEEVAKYMNEHFICIKVDREEHPDVDHLYMDAVQAITGSGGWPLNTFVTPSRLPFSGGTYYPPRPAYNRPSWMQVLQHITNVWKEKQPEVMAQSEQMLQYLQKASQPGVSGQGEAWDMATCREMADNLLKQADKEKGGFGTAPKFPGTMAISFLLEHYHFTRHEPSLQQALRSLDAMIDGGIYDQIGGGFARYATDAAWLVPHFEKMLYDNALLVSALCDAYSIKKDERYKKIAEETIGFVERELKDASGGYYSALDADSEGEEGKFYTWTWEEWLQAMGTDDTAVAAYLGVSAEGNWEGTNILHIAKSIELIAEEENISIQEAEQKVEAAKRKLFAHRASRARPMTDDKSLLSWNALMNISLCKAGVVFGNEAYLQRATAHIEWMLGTFSNNGQLLHVWKQGVARITANLDDYAYLIQALLQLAAACGETKWILKANELIGDVMENFLHEGGNYFYYTSKQQVDIPVRKTDTYDGATPSANAVMAHNLLIVGLCMERNDRIEQAAGMLRQVSNTAMRYIYSFSYWGLLLQRYAMKLKIIACAGPEAGVKLKELQQYLLPQCYLLTSKKEISDIEALENKYFADKTFIFVCTTQYCLEPVADVQEVLRSVELLK